MSEGKLTLTEWNKNEDKEEVEFSVFKYRTKPNWFGRLMLRVARDVIGFQKVS